MAIFMKVYGVASSLKRVSNIAMRSNDYVKTAVNVSIMILESKAKQLIATGYYSPAIDTGALRASVAHQIAEYRIGDTFSFYIGISVFYGVYVHEGTPFMLGRPFLSDALKQSKDQIIEVITMAVRKAAA